MQVVCFLNFSGLPAKKIAKNFQLAEQKPFYSDVQRIQIYSEEASGLVFQLAAAYFKGKMGNLAE